MVIIKRIISLIIIVSLCLICVPSFTAQISADIEVFPQGSEIVISGKTASSTLVSTVITDGDVTEVTNEVILDGLYAMGETQSNQNGEYSLTLPLSQNLSTGTYKAFVSAGGTGSITKTFQWDEPKHNEIYVDALNGSDDNTGSYKHPVKTIEKAKELANIKKQMVSSHVVVYLRGGNYYIDDPLSFTHEDSGVNGYKIIYSAYNNETPVISGGSVIDDWQLFDEDKNIYEADAKDITDTRQLYVNGVRATRARGEDFPTDIVTLGAEGCSGPVDMVTWRNQSSIELVYRPIAFTNSRCPVDKIEKNGSASRITMQEPAWTYMNDKGRLWGMETDTEPDIKQPWYIENAYELLDEPGEWYFDKTKHKFYYMPHNDENMENAYVVAGRLEELLTVYGSEDLENFAQNIEFNGITFAESTWLRPNTNKGHIDAQNNFLRCGEDVRDALAPAAVTVSRAKNISFENCTFTRLGITGINMVDGIDSCTIRGSRFYDISGGAMTIGNPNITLNNMNPSDKRLCIKNVLVNNNYIEKIAVEYRSASAIGVGYPIDTEFSHNEICDIPYSGFHIGYQRSGSEPNVMKGVKVINNYIHNVLNDYLYDGGAIYTNGKTGASAENPNIIAGNYIVDQYNDSHVLYNDNASQFWHHENNVVDLRRQERIKWHKERIPTWAGCTVYGDYKGITYNDNYTTTIENRLGDRLPEQCTEANTHVFPTAQWPQEAWDIINNAGLEKEYNPDYCENIDLRDASGWNGNVKEDTLILHDGEKASYTKEKFNEHILHFNFKLGQQAAGTISLTADNGNCYSFVLNKDGISLKNGSNTCESSEFVLSYDVTYDASLKIKETNAATILAMCIDEEEIISHTATDISGMLTLSAKSVGGEFLLGMAARTADGTQLLKNNSFESGTTYWNNRYNTITSPSPDAHEGNYSVKVEMTANYGDLYQNVTISNNKYYDVSVWIKLLESPDDTGENDYAGIRFIRKYQTDENTTNPKTTILSPKTPLKKGEWVQLRGYYHDTYGKPLVDKNNVELAVRIGEGTHHCTYLMDDFTIKEAVPEVKDALLTADSENNNRLSFTYEYENICGLEQRGAYYELYSSANEEFDNMTLIKKGNANIGKPTYIDGINNDDSYFRLELKPIDSLGMYGEKQESDAVVPMRIKAVDTGEKFEFSLSVTSAFKSKYKPIIALYRNGVPEKINYADNSEFSLYKAELDSYKIKAFMLESCDTLKPICESIAVNCKEVEERQ